MTSYRLVVLLECHTQTHTHTHTHSMLIPHVIACPWRTFWHAAARLHLLPSLLASSNSQVPALDHHYRCSSSHTASSSSSSKPTLREDLGSGAALGTISGSDDPAKRRNSLLTPGGRFYETVIVQPAGDQQPQQQKQQDDASCSSSHGSGYQLLLRKYSIKTPGQARLVLPTRSLALAVAAEWEWLPTGRPLPHAMPLTSLAATAIDQPRPREKTLEHLLKYVHTDAACIRYEPGPLERRQQRALDPLLQWAAQALGWRLHTSHSIFGTTQPDEAVAAVQAYLAGLDSWQLAAAEQLVQASKSVVIAAALLHGRISVAQAVSLARLEEDFQLEDWGMVEAGHDLDIADTHTRIAAPAVFARLLQLP